MNLARGALLANRYELLDRIGQGGIGDVWEALDRSTNDSIVAIKVLRSAIRGPTMDARFAREGALLARVRSPWVCRLLSAEIDPLAQVPFLVVERLVGTPLDRALPRRQGLPFDEARVFTEQILRGLSAVHEVGIIHRDLKPQNVFLADDAAREASPLARRAVLIDFGVGKLLDDGDSLTTSAATIGSPRYMAPEQLGGSAHVDERCDVYAAATVAFRMLAGVLPFDSDKPMNVLALKTTYAAPTLQDRTSKPWPAPVEGFFARALARDPNARPRNGAQALEAWTAACAGLPSLGGSVTGAGIHESDDLENDETPVLSRPRR